MIVDWTDAALADLDRVTSFLKSVAPEAARSIRRDLLNAPDRLLDFPRIGPPMREYAPAEVRRLIVGQYEIRYELLPDIIRVVRLWHTREDRSIGPG